MFKRYSRLVALLGVLFLWPTVTQAQIFLVSAGYYSSLADGTNAGTAYRYGTNSNSGDFRLTLNLNGNIQSNAISYPLAMGNNNFTFTVTSSVNPGAFGGLLLFFNSTGISFNPTGSTPLVAANLAAVAPTTSSSSFIIPAASIGIRNYVGINDNLAVPYSGDTVFNAGGFDVTISAFSSGTLPSGSFTLNVTSAAVPEPATLVLFAVAGLGGSAVCWKLVRRRRRRGRSPNTRSASLPTTVLP